MMMMGGRSSGGAGVVVLSWTSDAVVCVDEELYVSMRSVSEVHDYGVVCSLLTKTGTLKTGFTNTDSTHDHYHS